MIRYLTRDQIDTFSWDRALDRSMNTTVYGYSWFLDRMAAHWDALILGDYEVIMPLPWNRKYGLYYIYPPYFTQQLGLYSPFPISPELVREFMVTIPPKFRLRELFLNSANPFSSGSVPGWEVRHRSNFLLDLSPGYARLSGNYKTQTRRNIHKALQSGLSLSNDISLEEIIPLSLQKMKLHSAIQAKHYTRFRGLAEFAIQQKNAFKYAVRDKDGQLLASALFFVHQDRSYYLLVGNAEGGRELGASHLLIDGFIREYAGQRMILDFEGSDQRGLAFFYGSFGAREEKYPFVRFNRLPWPIRWLKA